MKLRLCFLAVLIIPVVAGNQLGADADGASKAVMKELFPNLVYDR